MAPAPRKKMGRRCVACGRNRDFAQLLYHRFLPFFVRSIHSAIILSKALLPFSCFVAYLVAYFSAEKTPG